MKKVLVVDDTKNIRMLLTKCLQLEGYDVSSGTNGSEALEMIYNNNYDLIFLDIKMPELSGTEVLKQIRKNGICTPVIIITAFPTIKNAVDCTQLGAIKYLQKPFTADRLRCVLNELNLDSQNSFDTNNINKLLADKNYDEVIKIAAQQLKNNPSDSAPYHMLSDIYAQMGDIDKATKFKAAAKIFD